MVTEETMRKAADALMRCRITSQEFYEAMVRNCETLNMIAKMAKKKMTKAEAFEWLDGKKIRTEGNHEKVLRKLFNLGFVWKNLRDTRVDLDWQSGEVYGLTISNDEVAWWNTPHLFETHSAEQVSADDILSIEVVEEDNKNNPKIFSDYVAIIQSQLVDDEVVVITKKNFITMVK